MLTRFRATALTPIAVVIGSLIAGALYTWMMGEDANWDWQNYHEYNVWAVINGRYATDVMPSGFQAYFNPLVYFPVYYLRHFLPPPYGGLIIGAVHGLNLALIYGLSRILLGRAASAPAIVASILIAACGPMTLSEVGTSLSDILTSLPIIAGILVILTRTNAFVACHIIAGVLIGAAVGLKLTNAVFAIGVVASLAFSARPLMAFSCIAIGGAIGSAITGGAWSLMLWREFGNPVFPLFNGFFESPELRQINILDRQFIPRSFFDALAYPFYWLIGDNRSSEFPFRDARFAILMLLVPVAIAVRLRQKIAIFSRRDFQFLIIFAVSYGIWLAVFSIQRYAVVLELLCGPLIVLIFLRLLNRTVTTFRFLESSVPMAICVLGVGVAIVLWSQPGDWWRRPWSNPYQPEISGQLAQPATYFLMDKPVAYIAPLLPPGSRFYQLADIALPVIPDGTFDRRIRAGLADPLPGGIRDLQIAGRPVQQELLKRYGLTIDASKPCVEIESVMPALALIESCPIIALE